MPTAYIYLSLAIVAEVFATSALKSSEGFTRLWPSVVVVAGYSVSFVALAQCLKTIPIGVAYAVWSGLGVVLITAIGWLIHGQKLDEAALAGLALIVAGVATIQLFSGSTSST